MTARRLLVVTTGPIDPELLREEVRRRTGQADAELKIVAAPASVSPLQWLTSDEDSAREEAAQVAEQSARAVEGETAGVETEVGDTDPVQAIEDALRTFEADEVIVVTRRSEEATWLEQDAGAAARERFGVPITQLAVDGG